MRQSTNAEIRYLVKFRPQVQAQPWEPDYLIKSIGYTNLLILGKQTF